MCLIVITIEVQTAIIKINVELNYVESRLTGTSAWHSWLLATRGYVHLKKNNCSVYCGSHFEQHIIMFTFVLCQRTLVYYSCLIICEIGMANLLLRLKIYSRIAARSSWGSQAAMFSIVYKKH